MLSRLPTLPLLSASLVFAAISGAACSSAPTGAGAAGGASGAAAASGAAGTAGGGAAGGGAGGAAGSSAGAAAGSAGTRGLAQAGSGGSAGAAGAGQAGSTATTPPCLTNDVNDGVSRALENYIECDVEDQAIDFDVAANYAAPRKPGYDPAQTTVSTTAFGTALTGFEVQECHPYCYRAALTIGVDLIAGNEQSLRGEVLFDFPATVAPIANAVGRDSLGWVFLDGPPLPPGTTLTLKMILKSADKGILLANTDLIVTPQKWFEFKYFPIESGFDPANLTNIQAIGFRITLAPAESAVDWHGVIYADHFQLRQ